MGKKNSSVMLVAITVLTVLIVVLLGINTVRRSTHIHLPEEDVQQAAANSAMDGSAINQIVVRPDTVQSVIETLRRKESYSRSVSVEQIWTGGSGVIHSEVYVKDGWTRVDTKQMDGSLRHSLSDGETVYIWYDEEETWFEGPVGVFSTDDEQWIPTYEDLLSLPVEDILLADYRSFGGTDCIYVESRLFGERKLCWWVSVSTGLLTAAEKYEGDVLVYRMTTVDGSDEPGTERFLLPGESAPPHE